MYCTSIISDEEEILQIGMDDIFERHCLQCANSGAADQYVYHGGRKNEINWYVRNGYLTDCQIIVIITVFKI